MGTSIEATFVETIAEGRLAVLERVRRGGRTVLVRRLRDARPSADAIARLRYGAALERALDTPGLLKVLGLEEREGSVAVVLEDFGARSLRSLLVDGRLDVGEAVRIASLVARALGAIHARRVIHKALAPSSVLVSLQSDEVRITDLDRASRLAREVPALDTAGRAEMLAPSFHAPAGSTSVRRVLRRDRWLAYAAPEQTGRTNRAVDARADLYALGVVLYEMLTGHVPFDGDDPATVVCGHLAIDPIPPDQLRPSVPRALSDVVLKLLAKDADDRYQSALGVVSDLNDCLGHLLGGATLADFQIGRNDVGVSFEPQRLYGREHETRALAAAIERAHRGASELFVVSGPPGSGKSALVNELRRLPAFTPGPLPRPSGRERGYFCAGAFDPIRASPYGALAQALGELVRELTAESEARAATLRAHVAGSVGSGAELLVEVIPELAAVVTSGENDARDPSAIPGSPLGPIEARDRFDLAFQQLVDVLATKETPLAIFLDDLQWADEASLRMLEILLRDPSGRHLAIVCAVSDGGRAPIDAPARVIAAARQGPTAVHEVSLGPLSERDVGRLLADALGAQYDTPRALAEFVYRRTSGSPLFVHQLLAWLRERGLMLPSAKMTSAAHLDRLENEPVPKDAGALFGARIAALPAASQRAIEIASCLGARFDLAELAALAKASLHDAAEDVWPAVEAGLLLTIGESYRYAEASPPPCVTYIFVHERAHAAALARVPPERVRAIRAEAALLEASLADASIDASAIGALGARPHDGIAIAQAELAAGRRARRCNAFAAAARHFEAGIAALADDDAWEGAYSLAFALRRDHAESAHLDGRTAEAEAELDLVLGRARSRADKVEIHRLRMMLAQSRGDHAGAVRVGREALELHGVALPERDGVEAAIAAEVGAVNAALAGRRIESLLDVPEATDPDERARIELLALSLLAAAQFDPEWLRLTAAMIVHRSLLHGHAPFSSLGYSAYGTTVAEARGDGGAADELGTVALRLAQRLDGPRIETTVRFIGSVYASPWRRPLSASFEPLEQAFASALTLGSLRLAGLTAMERALLGLLAGEDLYTLQDRVEKHTALLRRSGETTLAALTAAIHTAALRLTRGTSPDVHDLDHRDPDPRERADEPMGSHVGYAAAITGHHVLALQHAFLFEEYEQALAHAARATAGLAAAAWHPIEAEHRFYHALLLAALDASAPLELRDARRRTIDDHRDRLAFWAESCPTTWRHRHLMVTAEAARIAGDGLAAMDLYERAMESAQENGHPGHEALAAELAARFHANAGRARAAQAYLLEAREAYARWGADAKVADLDRRHADLAPERPSTRRVSSPLLRTSGSLVVLDTAVLRALRNLSAQVTLTDLFRVLMTSVLDLSAAPRAVLLLRGARETTIDATRDTMSGAARIYEDRTPIHDRDDLPRSILDIVERTNEAVALEHAAAGGSFRSDPYVLRERPRSVLCLPIVKQRELVGVLYVENKLLAGAFGPERRTALELLTAQAAISLENARAHEAWAQRVRSLEQEIVRSQEDLKASLLRLKDTQKRLLVQEKLASLGALTAGIAHEIKNPLNLINNFAESSVSLADELLTELGAHFVEIDPDVAADARELLGELRKNAAKINEHGRRADDIVRAMLEHSRGGSAERRAVDLNALVKEYVNLAYQGFRSQDPSFNTTIEASYAAGLGTVSLVPQDIGRVFLNLVNNACYAVHAKKKSVGGRFAPLLRIATTDLGPTVQIRIRDNGLGIPASVREKIWTPFFTTKPTGDGTGLGLSISADIVQGMGGSLDLFTEEGEYTEFVITIPRRGESDPGL